jgi:alpha-beta hydrolase superfamily lysophospholipase
MDEKAICFGSRGTLVGVVNRADSSDVPAAPAVVMLNSGILHRVGACRLHVKVARMLAEKGVSSLRFDHGGIGDSAAARGTMTFEDGAVAETVEALNYLETTLGVRKFVLFGLCSGADIAFRVAIDDARIVGLVQLDPWVYPTMLSRVRHSLSHYSQRLSDIKTWRRWMLRNLRRLTLAKTPPARKTASNQWYVESEYVRETPPKKFVEDGLRTLMARNVPILAIMSGGQRHLYNYNTQFRRSFSSIAFGSRLATHYLPQATHIFTGLADQRYVLGAIEAWFEAQMLASTAAQPSVPWQPAKPLLPASH